jgi:hypothetical protein
MGAKANILIDQGADYSTSLTVTEDDGTATDLTGYTGAGQIRKHYASASAYDFVVTFSADRSNGVVTLSLGRAVTETIEAGRYVYDVEITSSANNRTRLVEGIATITPQVTKT